MIIRKSILLALVWSSSLLSQSFAQLKCHPIVVVEQSSWISDARKIASKETLFLVWSDGDPKWFEGLAGLNTQILILHAPPNSDREREMWQERLSNQGCKVVSLEIDRVTNKVTALQIYRRVFSALLDSFPESKPTWIHNFQRAMRSVPAPNSLQKLTCLARAEPEGNSR